MTSRFEAHLRVLVVTSILAAVAVTAWPRCALAAIASPEQTPETLCRNAGAASNAPMTSYEDFKARFGKRFKSEEETRFAWRVYQAVHDSNATVVLGRLADTKDYVGKEGYCVLSNLRPYSIAINDVFLYGGIDRGARFRLVSEPPHEIMSTEADLAQAENDPETYWRVIYNHELEVLRRSGEYMLPEEITPPHDLEASSQVNANAWNGTYSDGSHVYAIRSSGNMVTGTGKQTFEGKDFASQGGAIDFGTCTVSGNTADCPNATGEYHDSDKSIATAARCTLTSSGDTLTTSCTLTRADATWHVAPYDSAVHVGATFADTDKRVK